MNITVRSSDIKNYGNQIIGYSDEFNDEIKKMNTLIDSINMVWDGADALKYINIMKEKYVVGLEEIKNLLEEYGKYLGDVPEVYMALDEAFSTKNIDV